MYGYIDLKLTQLYCRVVLCHCVQNDGLFNGIGLTQSCNP